MSIVERGMEEMRPKRVNSARKLNRAMLRQRPLLENLEKRYLLSAPPLPVIPTGSGTNFLITASPYNAVGDGTTNNTTAIQDAINACNAAGGGTVEVPDAAGAFECGAISMKSNVNLQIDSGAELQALSGLSASVFITVNGCSNWEITGLGTGASMGTIDGNSGGLAGTLNLIKINDSSIGLIQEVNVNNSPHEHIQCGSGLVNNVTINDISINTSSTAANTDGIDPAGQNWLIENCTISDGDDDIAVKPQDQYCANIDVENCTILAGHGISVGGETNAGFNGFIVNNVTFNGTTNGLRLKADRGNGGFVENVSYSNITMTNVEYPILIDSYYNQSNDFPTDPYSDPGFAVNSTTPIWENISFTNITSTDLQSGSLAAAIYGIPEAPVTNISFDDVNITALTGMQIDHVRNMSFDSSSHITVSSGPDIEGTTSSSYPTPVDSQIVAANYTNIDIGSPTVPFDTSESVYDPDAEDWTVNGGGANISGASDQFNYSYQSVTGDSSVAAQLTSLTGPGGGAVPQAGVMYRQSTDAADPFAAVVQTTNGQIIFEWRATSGGTMQSSAPISLAVGSAFVKVERFGNNFAGFYSTNGGTTYTQIGSTEALTGMGASANAGLAVTANSNGDTAAATFDSLAVTSAPSSQLAYAVQPSNATAGVANSPSIVVDIEDAGGTINTSNDSDVTLAVASGPGSATGTLTVAAVDGVATFNNVILDTAGAYTLLATDGSLSSATSSSFTISAAAAATLAFSQQPTSTQVSDAITPPITVDVEDQFGNVVATDSSNVTLATATGPAAISGTTTIAASNGVATFSNISAATLGAYTIQATDGSLTAATSNSFDITSPTGQKLVFVQEPTNVTAGTAISPAITVDVEDNGGDVAVGDSSQVTLSIASGTGAFTSTQTVAAVNGVATFSSAIIDTAGSYTLLATDGSLTSATSSSFLVTPAAATQFVFAQQPTNTVVGAAISPAVIVDVDDQFGNVVTTNTSNVTLNKNTGPGSLSGTATVAAVAGVATFSNISFATIGAYTIDPTGSGLSAPVSNSFNITALPPTKLGFAQAPGVATAGSNFGPSVSVDVLNSNNAIATADSSNVTISINSGPGTLIGTLTIAAVNGVATFSDVAIDTAGTYTLEATDGSLTSATTGSFTVGAAAASQLAFSQQPTGTVVNLAIAPAITVDVEDQFGNVVTTDSSDVSLATASGPGALSGTTTVAAANGVATFSDVTIATAGTYTIQATDGSLTSATSNSFNIALAVATKVVFTQQPTDVTAGNVISPAITVSAEDSNGNLATTNSSNVTLSIATGSGTLLGTVTAPVVNGVATFNNISLDKAGTYTLQATDSGLTGATSTSFTVAPGTATQIVIADQHFVAAQYGPVTLETILALEDQYGNVATNNSSSVTVSAGTTLSGQTTVPVVNGIAQFHSLSTGQLGTYQLTFSDGALSTSSTNNFQIMRIPLKWRDWFEWIELPTVTTTAEAQNIAEANVGAAAPSESIAPGFVVADRQPTTSDDTTSATTSTGGATSSLDSDSKILDN